MINGTIDFTRLTLQYVGLDPSPHAPGGRPGEWENPFLDANLRPPATASGHQYTSS